MIRNLRKISGLRVVPAISAFTFKDNKAHDHIRRQLPEVQYVLDGVVSIAAGNTLRITVELEDLNKGLVVWDKDYEGRTDDTNLFAMQSAIAAAVSDSLKVAILADERRALDEFPTTNLKAYELYVAGRYQLELLSHETLPRAIELFEQAIAADPQFFDAYIARSVWVVEVAENDLSRRVALHCRLGVVIVGKAGGELPVVLIPIRFSLRLSTGSATPSSPRLTGLVEGMDLQSIVHKGEKYPFLTSASDIGTSSVRRSAKLALTWTTPNTTSPGPVRITSTLSTMRRRPMSS